MKAWLRHTVTPSYWGLSAAVQHQIEGRTADQIARELTAAFDKFCAPAQQQAAATD